MSSYSYTSRYRWRPRDQPSLNLYTNYTDTGRWSSRDRPHLGGGSGITSSSTTSRAATDTAGVLRVREINLRPVENAEPHHTDKYEITQDPTFDQVNRRVVPRQLVVRRGQGFSIDVIFDRAVNRDSDEIKLKLEAGEAPRASTGTSVELKVKNEAKSGDWGANLVSAAGSQASIKIFTPPTCIIAKWRLTVVTAASGKKQQHQHKEPIYIILNPWCEDDPVYLTEDDMRDEYILADHGRVYRGTKKQIGAKPWNFGQFEDFVLDCVFYLLDKSGLSWKQRGNVVLIARKISAIVNSCDEDGVLSGRWDGNYEGGTSPLAWSGSVKILRKFWEDKKPVKYGQCWVFSAVTTTVCRAIGLPARSVTNFASAHDSDGSITIDNYWTETGEPIDEMNIDSVWNFHVWNDVWMARPDLPSGHGGWQAIDATPQETSDGVYCAGPSPLTAIKNGESHMLYDTPFIFAEVNADRVHWMRDDDGGWSPLYKQNSSIGKSISTKAVKTNYRQDVTGQYKYPEGSAEERAAVYQAVKLMGTKKDAYEVKAQDVRFELENKEFALVGQPFKVVCIIQNDADVERTVDLTLSADIVYYTGVTAGRIKREANCFFCEPKKEKEVSLVVDVDEYLDKLVDMCNIKVNCMARVQETKQSYCDSDDFRLVKPDLQLKAPSQVRVGQEYQLEISFTNPLKKVTLTKCGLTLEGAGLQSPVDIAHKDVSPGMTIKNTVTLKAKRPGEREIIATFNSKQLADIHGSTTVTVLKA